MLSHTDHAGGQPQGERPAGHLDRVWPDTGPEGNRLVAAKRALRSRSLLAEAGRRLIIALGSTPAARSRRLDV